MNSKINFYLKKKIYKKIILLLKIILKNYIIYQYHNDQFYKKIGGDLKSYYYKFLCYINRILIYPYVNSLQVFGSKTIVYFPV